MSSLPPFLCASNSFGVDPGLMVSQLCDLDLYFKLRTVLANRKFGMLYGKMKTTLNSCPLIISCQLGAPAVDSSRTANSAVSHPGFPAGIWKSEVRKGPWNKDHVKIVMTFVYKTNTK